MQLIYCHLMMELIYCHLMMKEAGNFLHVQNHDLVKFIIRQWYTFNKNFEYQNEERHHLAMRCSNVLTYALL